MVSPYIPIKLSILLTKILSPKIESFNIAYNVSELAKIKLSTMVCKLIFAAPPFSMYTVRVVPLIDKLSIF